ncbi:MAG: acyl-CoA desaturase [Proteobacteria bacterium]|nr:acyl-CoA desaturase [Pseudomonadota bacterium]
MKRIDPRIEADAYDGEVVLDARKSAWVIAMGGMALAAVVASSWNPVHIGLAAAFCAISLCCGHSVGLHRFVIHDAGRVPIWLERVLILLAASAGMGGPLSLIRHHEIRDWAQRQSRSHPWLRHGQRFLIDVPKQVMCRIELAHPPRVVLERGREFDLFYRAMDAGWPLLQVPIGLVAWAIGGWEAVAWIVGMRVFVSVVMHQVVGWLAHNRGHVHHEQMVHSVQGHNLPVLGFLSFGEGWHNNHHAYSWSAKLGLRDGEWDPGWWFISLLARMGLVWNVRVAELPVEQRLRLSG